MSKRTTTITLSETVKEAAKEAAKKDNRSLSSWIDTVLRKYLKIDTDSPQ